MSKKKGNFKKEVEKHSSWYRPDDSWLLKTMDGFFKEESERYRRIKKK